jgi:ATP-dependent Clp protease protease subunit
VIGKINIIGDIGSYENEQGENVKGVDLLDVVTAVNEQRKIGATSFEVIVDSLGGFVHVGFDLYDYLKSIPEEVTTIAKNKCASIATVIFLAGNKRIAECPLMIHNPWISNLKGDADQIQEAADEMRAEEDRLIKFYADHTGMDKIALDALMKNETYIYPDVAFKLGFTTEQPIVKLNTAVAYKAVAKLNDNMSKDTKVLMSKMDEFIKSAKDLISGKAKVKNLAVAEEGGKTLVITNADGTEIEGMPVAGNIVTIDGAVADGVFMIPEMGMTITVVAGAITDVAMVEASTTEAETANKKIEELTAENSALKTEIENSKKEVEELNAKFSELEGVLSIMKGKTDLPQAKAVFKMASNNDGSTIGDLKARKKELQERLKK